MAKWTEKHIYPWMEWMRFIYATWNNINIWTVTPTSVPKFFVFTLNITLGSLLMGLLIGLMAIPQTIEWIMKNIGDEVEKLEVNKDGVIKKFAYVTTTLFILIPISVTWGLPKLILSYREEKQLRRVITMEQRRREMLRQETEALADIRGWTDINCRVERLRGLVKKKDFRPKKEIKAHTMVEPSRGNYSIAFGSNNVATGNSFSLNGNATIRIDRENNTSTAYIRTDNMT
jgi:hypothetical protein